MYVRMCVQSHVFMRASLSVTVRQLGDKTDVQSIYDAGMSWDETSTILTAHDMVAAGSSPFSLYCKYHANRDKMDPPDPFLRALSDKGLEHESDVRESDYPHAEDITYETPEDGFLQGLQSMARGVDALSECPLYWLPDGMMGRPDILEKRQGRSVFGAHHYVVREIKMAMNITESHVLQGAFYAKMLGHIQGRQPDDFHVTNGDKHTTTYQYAEHADRLLKYTQAAARIIRGDERPPAIYGCGSPPWTRLCNETAMKNNDVSLVSGVGASMRNKMIAAGLHTVRDVASLSSARELQGIRGVGKKTSEAYFDAARAISRGKPVKKSGGMVALPDRSTEIFLDLEGLNAVFDDTLTDYLIGALVREKDGTESYHAFVAERKREDVMLLDFLDFMDMQSDYVIYHWHNYERVHMRSLMTRHGRESHMGLLEPDVMLDLHVIATKAYAFPTYTNSIKDVAKYLGFAWRHGGDVVGATSAIDMYLRYAKDLGSNREGMQLIIDYNEDDCMATRVIKDWLASR